MATDPWAIDANAGAPAYSGQELRLTTIVPFVAGAGASLGARSGVVPKGSGTELLVQAQASPNMTVQVNPGVVIVQGSISATQGAYTWALDAAANLTIAAAHATLSRTDLVVVRVRDANVDTSGQRDGSVQVITGTAGAGTPSPPTDATYFTLAQIAVRPTGSGGGTIVAGDVTDKRQFTAAAGGVILCDNNSEPAANTVPPGTLTYRSDLGVHRYSNGSAYTIVERGVIGGNRWTGGGNLVTGINTAEFIFTNSGAITIPPLTTCTIKARFILLGTATGDVFVIRIRETNLTGPAHGDVTWKNPDQNFAFTQDIDGFYANTTAAPVTVTFVATGQRVAGSGNLTVVAGRADQNVYFKAVVDGPAGVLTTQTTP